MTLNFGFIFIQRINRFINLLCSGTDYKISEDLSNEADKSKSNFYGISDYIPFGNSSCPNRADGYLYYLNRNSSVDILQYALQNTAVFPSNTIHLVFQMALLNKNNDFYSMHQIVFKKYASGQLDETYDVYAMSNSYENSFDYFRAVLEVIFLIITSYYLYQVIKNLSIIYLEIESEYLKKQSHDLK